MRNLTEANLTEAVLAAQAGTPNPRLNQVMTGLIKHLHAFIREVEPTDEEWMRAIQFLTATGQMCDENRQEFILREIAAEPGAASLSPGAHSFYRLGGRLCAGDDRDIYRRRPLSRFRCSLWRQGFIGRRAAQGRVGRGRGALWFPIAVLSNDIRFCPAPNPDIKSYPRRNTKVFVFYRVPSWIILL